MEHDNHTEPHQIKVDLQVVKFDHYFDCHTVVEGHKRGLAGTVVSSIVVIVVVLLIVAFVAVIVMKRNKAFK